ncbi:DNA translocase FtsK 4TM domain-containing protein, partial [Albidovulum sp.]
MASYQARRRDPLLDQNIQAALERRGKELLGLGLVGLAILTGMMLASYSPDDPSWLAATDEPVRNLLGRAGAAIASPLFVIAGHGAWTIAVIFAAWGLRFLSHRGEERALGRVIFAPISVALVSVYLATHEVGPGWDHSFGQGGMFGDTVLGALLNIVPVGAAFGFKLVSALLAAAALTATLFVIGADRQEMKAFARFLLVGTIVAYDGVLRLLARAASAALGGAVAWRNRRSERRAALAAADPDAAVIHAPAALRDGGARPGA